MKRIIFFILLGILLINISRADNGFCFVPKISGKVVDRWSSNLVNATIEISSKYGKTPDGYPPYCMTNVSDIKFNSNSFKINDIIVASTGRSCSLRYVIKKFGYLESNGYIVIFGNKTNYSFNFKIEPNTRIDLIEYGTNKKIDGVLYVNGNKYITKDGFIKIPLTDNIVYIFYSGDSIHDSSSNITSIQDFWKENKIDYYIYKKPRVKINLYQDKEKTNRGENWSVFVEINNEEKFSSPIKVNYLISGCGISDSKSVLTNEKIEYNTSGENNCTINLDYVIFDLVSKRIMKKSIYISHEVSNKYNISYFVKDGYIYARVLDVNGNPVETNLSIVYNGKKIKMRYNGSTYYAKIPGNNFVIKTEKNGNKGILSINGNFIKKKPKINYKVILFEVILGTITGLWIYKSRKLKK